MTKTEEWKPVPGYEGLYEVAANGSVRSLDIKRTDSLGRPFIRPGRRLKPTPCGSGYPRVELSSGGRHTRKNFAVHRLVAETFIGPCPSPAHEVMHLDHDPSNINVSNLQWGTHSENIRATVDAGRYRNQFTAKETCLKGHPFSHRDKNGIRLCRICVLNRQRAYRKRRSA